MSTSPPDTGLPEANIKDGYDQEVIIVGRMGAPHGVRGEVHIHSYTTPPDNLLDYQPWLFRRRPDGRRGSKRSYFRTSRETGPGDSPNGLSLGDASDPTVWRRVDVRNLRTHQDHFLGRVEGFAEREEVAQLKGMEIGVPREQLPDPDIDEFYWRDLIGARVIDADGQPLGVVAGLLETGVHDVLRVRPAEAGVPEILIPFVKAYVVSVTAEEIRVDWDPAWLT